MNSLTGSLSATLIVGPLIAVIVALIGSVAAAFLFLRPGSRDRHRGFLKKICAHVNFDRFLIASILKFLYVFAVLYSVVYGLVQLFTGAPLAGLVWLALVPVGLRVAFEQLLLLLSVREELGETNDLLRRMQGLPPKAQAQPQPQPQPKAPPQPAPSQPGRSQPADPRYPPRPSSYPQPTNGFNGYTAQPRTGPAAPYPADYGLTQRYAPIRRDGYAAGYDAPPYGAASGAAPGPNPPQQVRPTPADGTGRFSALPRLDDRDSRKK